MLDYQGLSSISHTLINMISQKVRTNASISYFFLGWLFLLAKKNPNFADPFIRKHAKIATKGHVVFFIIYFLYSHFLSDMFSYSIPVIQITLAHCIEIAFFAALTIFIIKWVYNWQKSSSVENEGQEENSIFSLKADVFQLSWSSEAERMKLFLSYIPFLGIIIAEKYPNIVTKTGARVSSLFAFVYVMILVSRGFESLSMVVLFIGVLFLVYLGAYFFIQDQYLVPLIFEKIPAIQAVYEIVLSVPGYLLDIGRIVFGKETSLSFAKNLRNTQERDRSFEASIREYFTDMSLPFPAFWIFIPFCNVIFIPKLFKSQTTRYVLAIGQWLVITLLATIIWYFYGFTSSIELFLLFPIFYGIALIEKNVFVRIPLIYELYAIINTLTFGILSNTKRMKAIQKQDVAVSYKVE